MPVRLLSSQDTFRVADRFLTPTRSSGSRRSAPLPNSCRGPVWRPRADVHGAPHMAPACQQDPKQPIGRTVAATLLALLLLAAPAAASEGHGGEPDSNPEHIGQSAEPVTPNSALAKRVRQLKRGAAKAGQSLGHASEAAVEELKLRAALFDETQSRTEQLRKRTSNFVDFMWQSLE